MRQPSPHAARRAARNIVVRAIALALPRRVQPGSNEWTANDPFYNIDLDSLVTIASCCNGASRLQIIGPAISPADTRDTMSQTSRNTGKASRQRLVWFIALWLLGVAGTALLVLPFHLLVVAAMRH